MKGLMLLAVALTCGLTLFLIGYVLAGALTLAVMNLPTVMRTAQESLKTVPQSYREGAFGLAEGDRVLAEKVGHLEAEINQMERDIEALTGEHKGTAL